MTGRKFSFVDFCAACLTSIRGVLADWRPMSMHGAGVEAVANGTTGRYYTLVCLPRMQRMCSLTLSGKFVAIQAFFTECLG